MKPRINSQPVADGYARPDERIIEFSGEGGLGGLISVSNATQGRVLVDVYRTDPGVVVRSAALTAMTNAVTDFAGEVTDFGTDLFQNFRCAEVDALARLLVVAGLEERAVSALIGHAAADEYGETHGHIGEAGRGTEAIEMARAYLRGLGVKTS